MLYPTELRAHTKVTPPLLTKTSKSGGVTFVSTTDFSWIQLPKKEATFYGSGRKLICMTTPLLPIALPPVTPPPAPFSVPPAPTTTAIDGALERAVFTTDSLAIARKGSQTAATHAIEKSAVRFGLGKITAKIGAVLTGPAGLSVETFLGGFQLGTLLYDHSEMLRFMSGDFADRAYRFTHPAPEPLHAPSGSPVVPVQEPDRPTTMVEPKPAGRVAEPTNAGAEPIREKEMPEKNPIGEPHAPSKQPFSKSHPKETAVYETHLSKLAERAREIVAVKQALTARLQQLRTEMSREISREKPKINRARKQKLESLIRQSQQLMNTLWSKVVELEAALHDPLQADSFEGMEKLQRAKKLAQTQRSTAERQKNLLAQGEKVLNEIAQGEAVSQILPDLNISTLYRDAPEWESLKNQLDLLSSNAMAPEMRRKLVRMLAKGHFYFDPFRSRPKDELTSIYRSAEFRLGVELLIRALKGDLIDRGTFTRDVRAVVAQMAEKKDFPALHDLLYFFTHYHYSADMIFTQTAFAGAMREYAEFTQTFPQAKGPFLWLFMKRRAFEDHPQRSKLERLAAWAIDEVTTLLQSGDITGLTLLRDDPGEMILKLTDGSGKKIYLAVGVELEGNYDNPILQRLTNLAEQLETTVTHSISPDDQLRVTLKVLNTSSVVKEKGVVSKMLTFHGKHSRIHQIELSLARKDGTRQRFVLENR